VLVTHFMDEAQRLCDRLAVLLGGQVLARGTASELIESQQRGSRVRFTAPPAADLGFLRGVRGVNDVDRSDGQAVQVTGSGRCLPPVDFYTPSYVALVAATAGILSLPVHLMAYREQGVLRRFRASAIRPATLIGAHMAVAAALAPAGAVLLTLVSFAGYDAALPEDWLGVVTAYLVVIVAFTALGGLLGLMMPTARAAQGLGVLLFFVFMVLGGAGPPKEALPPSLQHIADVVPVTHAGAMLRDPRLYDGWDFGASAVMVSLFAVYVALTGWRLRLDDSR